MLAHEINLGDGDKYNEQTTPRGYAWRVEQALDAASRDEFQNIIMARNNGKDVNVC